jgi:hypothetical protein
MLAATCGSSVPGPAAVLGVMGGIAGRIPLLHRVRQRVLGYPRLLRQPRQRVGLPEDAELQLLAVVLAPLEVDRGIVCDEAAELVHRKTVGIEHHPRRHACIAPLVAVHAREMPDTGVARVGLVLIGKASAELVHENPRHHGQVAIVTPRCPHRKVLRVQPVGKARVGVPESIWAMEVPHVPEVGTEPLRHADTVTGIAQETAVEHDGGFQPCALHLRVGLKPAASQDHAMPRVHDGATLRVLQFRAVHLASIVAQEPNHAGGRQHRYRPAFHMGLEQAEEARPGRRYLSNRMWNRLLEFEFGGQRPHLDIAERVESFKRIVAHRRPHHEVRADVIGQCLHPRGKVVHAVGQHPQHVVRGTASAGGTQISQGRFGIERHAGPAGGHHGQAARPCHLLGYQYLRPAIGRLDGSGRAGRAITHDQYVARPLARAHRCRVESNDWPSAAAPMVWCVRSCPT